MSEIMVVAEIGCNHNGDVNLARKMMKIAKESGASAVKFQSFVPEKLVTRNAPKAKYQIEKSGNGNQLNMLKKLALSKEEYKSLISYAKELDIEIFSTAFDMDSIEFLSELGQSIWKIPSGEITNLPYLRSIAEIKCNQKKIILSTGMSTLEEVKDAVEILDKSENTEFTVLHCNTQYPTEDSDMNILAINELKASFPKWKVGLSDHSEGIVAALVSVGMGASFIEKHFTLDKEMEGPDHKASITPNELKRLCYEIHRAEVMLGTGIKAVTKSEEDNRKIARKSIVASRNIKMGEILTEENLTCKRPGTGINPMKWDSVLGKTAEMDFSVDELIICKGIEWEYE